VDEVISIKDADIAAHLKLPPFKLHCSMLVEEGLEVKARRKVSGRNGVKSIQITICMNNQSSDVQKFEDVLTFEGQP
jgi:hypothetical protein